VVPYPDSGGPCSGGIVDWIGAGSCLFDESGDALLDNTYVNDGFFGNPTNGDFGLTNFENGPTDCFSGNVEAGGAPVKTSPSNLEQQYPVCNGQQVQATGFNQFTNEVLCDSQVSLAPGSAPPCTASDHYPRVSKIVMHKLPRKLASMPNPCAGVPANPWCKAKAPPSGAADHSNHKH
jgi:hypothetical protein